MQRQYEFQFVVCALSAVRCRSHVKRYFKIQIVTFYVLINRAFVGKNSFVLIKMHGKTTIKKSTYVFTCKTMIVYSVECKHGL